MTTQTPAERAIGLLEGRYATARANVVTERESREPKGEGSRLYLRDLETREDEARLALIAMRKMLAA